jgi:hypothetical protein
MNPDANPMINAPIGPAEPDAGGMLSYLHKVKDGSHLDYIAEGFGVQVDHHEDMAATGAHILQLDHK